MKARLVQRQYKYILSVGMIVKNEEKYLGECLEALKPLLESVKSELVIVDTGSTDKTVEIARKHTRKIYHFDWINDFAAARNFALDKCDGEWFMFIDADEILSGDLSEMIDFFSDAGKREKYNSAMYYTKNYTTPDKTQSTIFSSSRIVKHREDLRFIHPIHESFNIFPPPTYAFNIYAEHYGYMYETEEQEAEKKKRNLILLRKELAENPDDIRVMCHIFQELKEAEREEYGKEIIAKAEKLKDPYAPIAFLRVILACYEDENYEAALSNIEEYSQRFKNKDVTLLEILVCKGASLIKLGKTEEAITAYEEYLELYDKYRADALDRTPVAFFPFKYIHYENRDYIAQEYNRLLAETGRLKVKVEGGTRVRIVTKEEGEAALGAVPDSVAQKDLPTMLKELEKNPDDIKIHAQILQNISSPEEMLKYLPDAVECVRRNKGDDIYARAVFFRAIGVFFDMGEYDLALMHMGEYLRAFDKEDMFLLDIYYSMAAILGQRGEYGQALLALDNYFAYYDKYKQGELDTAPIQLMPIICSSAESYAKIKTLYEKIKSEAEKVEN